MKSAKGSGALRVLLLTLVVLVVGFALVIKYAYSVPAEGNEESLTQVYRFADKGQIIESTLLDEDALVVGRACSTPVSVPVSSSAATPGPTAPAGSPEAPGQCTGNIEKFHASYPRSDVSTQQLIDRITASGAPLEVQKQTNKAVAKLIVTFLFPLIILANLFGIIFLSRSGESSISDIVGFGKLGKGKGKGNKKDKKGENKGISFADVAGAEEAVTELREVTDYLKDPKKYEDYGASAPKGVILFGPPGCGKTLLARAVAGESGVPFFSISGAEFVESLVGVGAARVRDLFRQVREAAPAIVFIDEIDAVGRRREGEGATGGEREQTVNQLLVEMDGFEVSAGIVVMAATNRPDILDPALLRPGRFDRHVTVEPPEIHGRIKILELHAKGKPISGDVEFESLARRTPGFTGADLANVINEAALLAIRDGEGTVIDQTHLTEAVQRVLHGPQRRGKVMSSEERKRVAFHECGHTLVAAALGRESDGQRVSIVARGQGLGQSIVTEESERVLLTRSEMENELAISMGGIAAEELVFSESSTTAQDDIERASATAREMVGRYGMSQEVGRVQILAASTGYLGESSNVVDSVSGHTMQEFDAQVKLLTENAEKKAFELLRLHRDQLQTMADALEEEETLEGATLSRLLSPVRPEVYALFGDPQGATTAGKPRTPRSAKPKSPTAPATK